MDAETAKRLLAYHSGRNPNFSSPKWINGFLGSLRPYRGALRAEAFHEVMECIRVVAPELIADTLERDVINDLWGIVHFGRMWGVKPDGMLRTNNLIAERDWKRLERWVDTISWTVVTLMDGRDVDSAFHEYEQQVAEQQSENQES